jgi:hypothetical protein
MATTLWSKFTHSKTGQKCRRFCAALVLFQEIAKYCSNAGHEKKGIEIKYWSNIGQILKGGRKFVRTEQSELPNACQIPAKCWSNAGQILTTAN